MIPTVDSTVRAVCEHWGVTEEDLRGVGKVRRVVRARQTVWFILFHQGFMNMSEIGREFKRDHTTIMHGVRVIAELEQATNDVYKITEKARIPCGPSGPAAVSHSV